MNQNLKIEFFYDCVSPYSWMAFEVLHRYKNIWNFELQLKPFYLGAIMKGSNNTPPGMNQAKAISMSKDLERSKIHFDLPIKRHPDFMEIMFQSLQFMRLVASTQINAPQFVEQLSRQLFLRIWSKEQNVDKDQHEQILLDSGITDQQLREKIIKDCDSQQAKELLKMNTDRVLDLNGYGAPFIIIHNSNEEIQCFFGSDRFEQIAFLLKKQYYGPQPSRLNPRL